MGQAFPQLRWLKTCPTGRWDKIEKRWLGPHQRPCPTFKVGQSHPPTRPGAAPRIGGRGPSYRRFERSLGACLAAQAAILGESVQGCRRITHAHRLGEFSNCGRDQRDVAGVLPKPADDVADR